MGGWGGGGEVGAWEEMREWGKWEDIASLLGCLPVFE